ncbi:esterase FrsA [Vibrio sp. TH_r3]|uniref:esterase FrsA n=1 Tax=Vibrio sp. TH_r3 TaxID=3082084 RepID=UPI002954AE52|nr:esterase FrsA [Vibrio sp. TH_r3]MDV7104995.1 esterase FrsA [Vibrio sp. TH_r3]
MSDNHKNLSETLFKKHKQATETSSLIQYMPSSVEFLKQKKQQEPSSWYRVIRRYQWIWQGIDPIEQEEVLAKIASSKHSRTDDDWLDTVMGFHSGNWAYEWTQLGMRHQKNAATLEADDASDEYFYASLCYSIAGYPHLKGDNLSIQAQALAKSAYDEAMKTSQYVTRQFDVPFEGKKIQANLHLPNTDKPQPVVMVSAGLDALQTDMWRVFKQYLAPMGIGMLTIDMPSIGSNSHWQLTEDSCKLHRAVLNELPNLPWVDHRNVGLLGYRFGGNAMLRLAFLEQDKIKACVTMGAPIHDTFSSAEKVKKMPRMYLDILASRLGKRVVDIHSLSGQMMAWSLKVQGFLTSKRTKVPVLALSLEGDVISPYSDNRLAALFSQYGKSKQISSKSISAGYEQSLDLAIKWLENELI